MKSLTTQTPTHSVDFQNGVLTITESKENLRDISMLVSAWYVFKSEGGTIVEAQKRLGLTFKENGVSFNSTPLIPSPLTMECHRTINGVSVYSCATVCAELDNCRLKNKQ